MSILSSYHHNFLKVLSKNHVKFMIVGGQAAIYYGVRRGTGDLDILIEPTIENGQRLLQAFKELGLEVDEIKPSEFEGQLFLGLGFEPDAVDIFTITPGIEFKSSYHRANVILDRDLSLKIISLEDLIKNKENLNREDEKGKLDEYDATVLKKILKSR